MTKSDSFQMVGVAELLGPCSLEVCCCCPRESDGSIDRAKIVVCKFRSKRKEQGCLNKGRYKNCEWKQVSVEVKKHTQVDGQTAYVVEALDLLGDSRA